MPSTGFGALGYGTAPTLVWHRRPPYYGTTPSLRWHRPHPHAMACAGLPGALPGRHVPARARLARAAAAAWQAALHVAGARAHGALAPRDLLGLVCGRCAHFARWARAQ
eukprot:4937827-Prymnesium_polylepis.1